MKPITESILSDRIDMLLARLRAGHGNQSVIVNEVIRAYNHRAQLTRRRVTDTSIRGWTLIEGGVQS